MPLRLNPLTGQFDLVNTSGGGGGSGTFLAEVFTLDATQIANKQVVVATAPTTSSSTVMIIRGAPGQAFSVDFTVTGSNISWSGTSLDGLLEIGDVITILHD